MTGLHESTLAISVYNAVARFGAMTREQALIALRRTWAPTMSADEVDAGVAYLQTRGMLTEAAGVLAPTRLEDGAAQTVIRNPVKQTELVFASGAARPQLGTVLA